VWLAPGPALADDPPPPAPAPPAVEGAGEGAAKQPATPRGDDPPSPLELLAWGPAFAGEAIAPDLKTNPPATSAALMFELERVPLYSPSPRESEVPERAPSERVELTRAQLIERLYDVLPDLRELWGPADTADPPVPELLTAIEHWNLLDGGALFRRSLPLDRQRIVVTRRPPRVEG
jgi:hypothetical protein